MRTLGVGLGVGVSVFGLALTANAATYKVGPTQQYKQLSEVVNLVAPGDVVEVDGDATYTGGVVFSKSGTAASKITVKGIVVNGKRPVISGGTNTIEAQGDHYVFEGLDITGGSFRCFYHHAHDITLRDSVVHDCAKHGILGADQDSGSMLLEYVEVYKCGGGTFDHQIYMATDETAHPKSVFRMQHCYVHDANGGNNVKSRAERNEIYYNWIEGAQYHELELIGPDGQNPALAREDSDVVGNVLVKTATTFVVRFGGDGTGETDGRYRFVNNTVITQPGGSAVFRLFHGLESVEMHNNVFMATGTGDVNLVRTVEAQWSTGSEQIAGSNNWVKAGATNEPSQWANTLTGGDPGFVAIATLNLMPTGASPLVNAGSGSLSGPPGYPFPSPLAAPLFHPPPGAVQAPGTAQARPVVGTIDVGAFEYGSGGGGTGGTGGTGGATGGAGGATGGAGGATGGAGGAAGSASGGAAGSATGGAGGASNGGTTGTGATGSGATSGSGGAAGGSAGGSGAGSSDDGGCGCRTRGGDRSASWLIALGLALATGVRRRRR